MDRKRILIVGGVAGGASCAARARRLSEEAEIIVFERGPYVSFANCGLPYYVGDVIKKEDDLLVATPGLFRNRFNIDVRVEREVTAIDREAGTVQVKDLASGISTQEPYDALVLSPGAAPVRPPLPGIDLPGIFVLRSIPDSRRIREQLLKPDVKRAVIVGGGFIGLEMAENLLGKGASVTIVEMLDQVMPPLDPEMAMILQDHLVEKGVALRLGHAVTGFEQKGGGKLSVKTRAGDALDADLVILSIGVRPEIRLAQEAGLEIGSRGGIRVDDQMRTSDDRIWAVGDAVEVKDIVTGEQTLIPLAGPANRQGRVAADAIFGRKSKFRGVQATSVCGVLGLTVAMTGASEKNLKRLGIDYEKVYLHPGHHVGYYPGAKTIHLKLLYSAKDGRVLGVQAVGEEGVEKRVDVIAMAIQKGATVYDLEEAELCYAPQYGAAKDPVNFAGMIAANRLRGDVPTVHWENAAGSEALFIDVRTRKEFDEEGHVEGALHVAIDELRRRLNDLPRDREILAYCGIGQRSYYATRILLQHGFQVKNLSGGLKTYKWVRRPAES